MITFLTIVHIAVCFFLVVIVLLQQGKGANMGATFGGSSQTVFGSEGPMPLLNKITTLAAITFMVTSIALAYISSHKSTSSVMKDFEVQNPQENGIERSAEPLPQSGSPDIPLAPADTAVPQAAPSPAEKTDAAPDAVNKPVEGAAHQEVGQVQDKKEKVEVPVSEGKTESKEK